MGSHRNKFAAVLVALAALAAGCTKASPPDDSGLELLALDAVNPAIVVPGSAIVVNGSSFVDQPWGTTRLRLRGSHAGAEVDVAVAARFVDFDRLEVVADDLFAGLGGAGQFEGEAIVEVESGVDGETYATDPLIIDLSLRDQLQPQLDSVQTGGLIFVNDPIAVQGSGLLLGGGEGTTYAVLQGCFTLEGGGSCVSLGPVEVPVVPEGPFDRARGHFAFAPAIAGIRPGSFEGTVMLRNRHAGGATVASSQATVAYDMLRPTVFSVSPTSASLGQYVDITGGGFVGGTGDQLTLVQLQGTFTPTGGSQGAPVDLLLVPEFVAGPRIRYVINEDDALAQAIDLRTQTGTFVGDLTPITEYGGDQVIGDPAQVTLAIAPVKQVVYFNFRPSYVESLRHFGLRAVDTLVRERVVAVVERDYATVNLEVRTSPPTDYALYAQVDISGPDPNGLGLLGYDNTPGKDTENQRLYDRIGGVNAQTQEDGYPGYGGVFIESLFAFSPNPGGYASSIAGADAAFDAIFDATRPDRGGQRVRASDLSGGVPRLTSSEVCPAATRSEEIACAVFVLGSLIGTTVTHEIGHSVGLANPYGEGFHNLGDGEGRIMDSGSDRPFAERAELFGQGPGLFCDEEYDYLRQILPAPEPADPTPRPSCF